MKNKILADKVRYYKEDDMGVSQMCQIMEDLIAEEKVELALQNLQEGNVTETQVKKIFKLTPEQTIRVLELYHNKVDVQS